MSYFVKKIRDGQYKRVLEEAVKASHAPSTVHKYSRSFTEWHSWCVGQGIRPLPAHHEDISRYLVSLYVDKSPFSKIETAFFSIKWHHERALVWLRTLAVAHISGWIWAVTYHYVTGNSPARVN